MYLLYAYISNQMKKVQLFLQINYIQILYYIMAAQSNAFSAFFAFAKSDVTLNLHCCHPF
jgi:hypothetical protein